MPPQYSSISWRAVMPAGASLTPGSRTRPDTEKVRSPLRPLRPLAGEPFGALLDDVAHPVEGLDVVAQGRAAKEPDLGRKGWPLPRQPTLALDAFEHRQFLAADIGAGAAAQVDARMRCQPGRLDCRNLAFEDRLALRVLVAEVDVNLCGLDHPGGDQHAFEETVRVGFEKIAVLEGAGLAFVAIDRHQPGRRLLPHEAPFAAGRKPRAAEPAQPGMLERLDHLVARALARQAGLQQVITAIDAVVMEADKFRDRRMGFAGRNGRADAG